MKMHIILCFILFAIENASTTSQNISIVDRIMLNTFAEVIIPDTDNKLFMETDNFAVQNVPDMFYSSFLYGNSSSVINFVKRYYTLYILKLC